MSTSLAEAPTEVSEAIKDAMDAPAYKVEPDRSYSCIRFRELPHSRLKLIASNSEARELFWAGSTL